MNSVNDFIKPDGLNKIFEDIELKTGKTLSDSQKTKLLEIDLGIINKHKEQFIDSAIQILVNTSGCKDLKGLKDQGYTDKDIHDTIAELTGALGAMFYCGYDEGINKLKGGTNAKTKDN